MKRISWLTVLLIALFFATSCGGDSSSSDKDDSDDTGSETTCTDGEIRYIECTPGGGGGELPDQSETNDDGLLVPDNENNDSGLITDEDSEETSDDDMTTLPSSDDDTQPDNELNGDEDTVTYTVRAVAGLQRQICRNNQWVDDGVCSADEATRTCENGEIRFMACGNDNSGMQKQLCTDGVWGNVGPCSDDGFSGGNSCEDGDTLTVPCGVDSSGTGTLICEDHIWVMTECDTTPCLNGDIQVVSCGQDSQGSQRRVCVAGSWKNDGNCTFNAPDGDLLVAKIERNAMGITTLIEEFTYTTDGTDTWKSLYRKKESVAAGAPIATTYETATAKDGAVLSRTTALTAGGTIVGWEEEEWGENGVQPLPDGTLPTDGRTRFTKLDADGLVQYEELNTFNDDGTLTERVTTYRDSGVVDEHTYFGTGEMLVKKETFATDGTVLVSEVRDNFGNMLMRKEIREDGVVLEDYINVHNSSLNKFHWTTKEFNADGNPTAYREKAVDGSSLYSIVYSYDSDGRIVEEKCSTPYPERKACISWEGSPVGNYTINYTYNGTHRKKIDKTTMVDGQKKLVERAIFAEAPPSAAGKIESYFTAYERPYCEHRYAKWEDREDADYHCDLTDRQVTSNGLIHYERWTWHVHGRLLNKVGKVDPDAPTDKTYRDSYAITENGDGKVEKIVHTDNHTLKDNHSEEFDYTWNGDVMTEKMYSIAGSTRTFAHNYTIDYTYTGDHHLQAVDFKNMHEDGTLISWDYYKYNDAGQTVEHRIKREDGSLSIKRLWFDNGLRKSGTKMADDGTTVVESYTYTEDGLLLTAFCEGKTVCGAAELGHEIGRNYTLHGIQQDYWNETRTYNGDKLITQYKVDTGLDDGSGTIIKTEPAVLQKYAYKSDGTRVLIEDQRNYPDCWTTPGVWDEDTQTFATYHATKFHELWRLNDDDTLWIMRRTASWIQDGTEVSHTFVEQVLNSHNLPTLLSCQYQHCNTLALSCKEAEYLGVPSDNKSVCNNAQRKIEYDSDNNPVHITEQNPLDTTVWDETTQTWQKVGETWSLATSERKIKGYTIRKEVYNSDGQITELLNDAPHGVNSSHDPALKFAHTTYEYDEHGNVAKESYLNRQNDVFNFVVYDNRYNEKDQLEVVMRKDKNDRILGSEQMLYGEAVSE